MYKNQVKRLEVMLLGALRREKMAETAVLKLETEIEHTNRLVRLIIASNSIIFLF